MRSGLLASALVIAVSVSSALMSGVPAHGSPDLLLDEGFEEGVDGWAVAGGALTATSSLAHSGSHSALFSADPDAADLATGLIQYSSIPIKPAGQYALSASFLKDDTRVQSLNLRVTWVDANGTNIGASASPRLIQDQQAWQSLVLDAESPLDAAFARVQIDIVSSAAGSFYVDDIQLEGPPPLPPTATPPATNTRSPGPSLTPTPSASAAPTHTPVATGTSTPLPTPTPTPRTRSALINGGFEEADEGVLSGWQKYGGELSQSSQRFRSGGHSGALRSTTDSTKWAFQALTISGGSAYKFDAYVLLDDPATREAYLRISWYASDDASGSAIAVSDSPQRLTGSSPTFRYLTTGAALAPPAARSANFRIMFAPASSAPATIYVDDASVQQAPPELAATPAPPPPAGEDEPLTNDVAPASESVSHSQRSAVAQKLSGRAESPYLLKINEVMYDPTQSGDDAGSEWLELYNAGNDAIDLAGWTLSDNAGADTLPSLTLSPHAFAVVAAGPRFREAYPDFSSPLIVLDDGRIGTGLANNGDHVLLLDPSGRLADAVSWGDDESVLSPSAPFVPAGHSIERSPAGRDTDAAADFVDNANPSPGRGIGESAVAGASAQRQVAGSSVVYPPSQAAQEASSNLARRFLVSIAAGVVALAAGLTTGLYARQRFR